jgi:hypothetical protein
MTTPRSRRLTSLALSLATIVLLAACAAATAPSPSGSPPATSSGPSEFPPGGGSDGGAGAGGGAVGDPGTGIGAPGQQIPIIPGAGQAALVIPRPGQLNPHRVSPTLLQASVDRRHVLVKVTWYGGVEPCYVLDSVRVEASGREIAISVFEGSSDRNAVCDEMARLKATIVDLGDLEPGTWTIASPGSGAPPVTTTIE